MEFMPSSENNQTSLQYLQQNYFHKDFIYASNYLAYLCNLARNIDRYTKLFGQLRKARTLSSTDFYTIITMKKWKTLTYLRLIMLNQNFEMFLNCQTKQFSMR